MTTTVQFAPNPTSIFQFPATLDGNQYIVQVTWNVFGCRYYVNIYTQAYKLIVSTPLIGSPLGYDLLSVVSQNNIAIATTDVNHTFKIGSVIPLVISGMTPSIYNGTYECNIMTKDSFSFPLSTTVQNATGLGQVNYYLSMTAGYFQTQLVYQPDSQLIVIQ